MISDYDQVELSNLQRQVIYQTDSVGELKVDSAKQRITATNPDCRVDAIAHELEGEELQRQIAQADVVIDCSDNFPTRFNINRYCVAASTPLVSGAAIRLEGQVATYHPANGGPCYQCLYKQNYENMATCEMEGVAGPVVGIIGTMQALQVIQLITGKGDQLPGKLLLFDGETMTWQSINIPKNPTCRYVPHNRSKERRADHL